MSCFRWWGAIRRRTTPQGWSPSPPSPSGSGFLGIPYAFQRAGLGLSLGFLGAITLLAMATATYLIEAQDRLQVPLPPLPLPFPRPRPPGRGGSLVSTFHPGTRTPPPLAGARQSDAPAAPARGGGRRPGAPPSADRAGRVPSRPRSSRGSMPCKWTFVAISVLHGAQKHLVPTPSVSHPPPLSESIPAMTHNELRLACNLPLPPPPQAPAPEGRIGKADALLLARQVRASLG